MIPYPIKTRTWSLTTPADGTFFDAEVNQVYADLNFLNDKTSFSEVIQNQMDFEEAIELISGNNYKIKDSITSLYLKAGDYLPHFITNDGDFILQTNNCALITCESGATILFDSSLGSTLHGRLHINTPGCTIHNLTCKSSYSGNNHASGGSSFLEAYFLITADDVSLYNCIAEKGSSGFRASNGIDDLITSVHHTMNMAACRSSLFSNYGYFYCYNMISCYLDGAGSSGSFHYWRCKFLESCYGVNAGDGMTFVECEHLSNCESEGGLQGFRECNHISGCVAHSNFNTSAIGFFSCNYISSSKVYDYPELLSRGFESCSNISSSEANNCLLGFLNCSNVSGCKAGNSTYRGYLSCNNVSGCEATNSTDVGFVGCNNISGCRSNNNIGYGYTGCSNISGCRSNNNGAAGFENCSQLTGCHSESNAFQGYNACLNLSGCQASLNSLDGFQACASISGCESAFNNQGFNACVAISGCRALSNTSNGFINCTNGAALIATGNSPNYAGNTYFNDTGVARSVT